MLAAWTRRDAAVWLAWLGLGALAGAAVTVLLLGEKVEDLTADNVLLMDQIERLHNRVMLLDAYGPASGLYVEAVEVTAHGAERARPALEQALKELLVHLVGQELERVNAATLHAALERRITVEGQEYQIRVRYIYVTPTVRVHVTAEPAGSAPVEPL